MNSLKGVVQNINRNKNKVIVKLEFYFFDTIKRLDHIISQHLPLPSKSSLSSALRFFTFTVVLDWEGGRDYWSVRSDLSVSRYWGLY